jgi:hypothetical protein
MYNYSNFTQGKYFEQAVLARVEKRTNFISFTVNFLNFYLIIKKNYLLRLIFN